MALMGRPRKFGNTTTFGFDLDVSMKKDIEAIADELNQHRPADRVQKYSKGDCIRLALQYWMDNGYPVNWDREKGEYDG